MATKAKAKKLQEKLVPDQVQFNDIAEADAAPRTPGATDVQFPTDKLQSKSKQDELMTTKLELSNQGVTPFGVLRAKDKDFRWLKKKSEAVDKANFQHWFAQNFDKMSPAEKKVAREIYPTFYAQRQILLKKQSENAFKLANIKLHGVRSKEDLQIQYMAEQGKLDIGPLDHLLNPQKNQHQGKVAFRRGLLNPFSVYGNEPASADRRSEEAKLYQPGASPTPGFVQPMPHPGDASQFKTYVLWKF